MNFKYYDILSSLVLGYAMLMVILYTWNIDYDKDMQIGYLAVAYILGYMINALGGLIEKYLNWGRMPSDRLLTLKKGKNYTGYSRIKFYDAPFVIEKLRDELKDPQASTKKMFSRAMSYSNADTNTRVPDFNAQYAFSRTLLTTMIVSSILIIINNYTDWRAYVVMTGLTSLCWNRYIERGFYYAREVLIEYTKKKR